MPEFKISLKELKSEIDEGECKSIVLNVPTTITEIMNNYQEAYKRLYPNERKPNKADIMLLLVSKGASGLIEMTKEINDKAQELEENKI